MDPLSDVLSLLRPDSYMFRGLDAGGEWSIHFARGDGIKCYVVVSGTCWMSIEAMAGVVLLEAGDCVLLPSGRSFSFFSHATATPVDAETFVSAALEGGVATLNGGGDCFGIGGYFAFANSHAEILLGMLPPLIHIRADEDKAALRWWVERIMREIREPQPGGSLIAQHLAHMLLILALRLHMSDGLQDRVGWLFALSDRQMSAAITAMHDDPARRWTLQMLAAIAGMSRSTFAAKFKRTVGSSAMDYLTRWRMLLAGDRLAHSTDPVSKIASSLGYDSDSAFSAAFKRVMNCSPRHYAQG